jgi:hypothetical protein
MRGYPKGSLSMTDYTNLLAMPEHADRAIADLAKLSAMDDSRITIDQGTEKAPRLVEIANPMPAWKRAGFGEKVELADLVASEPVEDEKIEPPLATITDATLEE